MDYISVEEAADKKKTSNPAGDGLLSLAELCAEVSISLGTGRNWMKRGKLIPEETEQSGVYFTKNYVEQLKTELQSGENPALKRRRNKKHISGNGLYESYVSEHCQSTGAVRSVIEAITARKRTLSPAEIQYITAECAIQLILQRSKEPCSLDSEYLGGFIEGQINLGGYRPLVEALIDDASSAGRFISRNPELFSVQYRYEEREDVLGLLYISCKDAANRKAEGCYYTPTKVVEHVVDKLCETTEPGPQKTILDPCCGTGNFLLQLPAEFRIEHIYGNDTDEISIKLARINLALKFKDTRVDLLCKNITHQEYLLAYQRAGFDYIIGNPPWGYEFSEEEKRCLKENFVTVSGKKIESYDVFIEKALSQMKPGGTLSFVTPEAILNVRSHRAVRVLMSEQTSIRYLAYLGNAFDKVQCPCVILQLTYTQSPMSCVGTEIFDGTSAHILGAERAVNPDYFCFVTSDEEYRILEKILSAPNTVTLENQAVFALGIVTGNNEEHISAEKTRRNEMVLRGANIDKYRINDSGEYLVFRPDKFQQVAPEIYYRAPEKLLYRFISSSLVFAYDDSQTLSLNSCNILIPKAEGLAMKYILAVLNSRIAQFVFQKQFHSVKVLRSHIEKIPIPAADKTKQQQMVKLVDAIMAEEEEGGRCKIYDEIDKEVSKLFEMDEDEYNVVKNAVN